MITTEITAYAGRHRRPERQVCSLAGMPVQTPMVQTRLGNVEWAEATAWAQRTERAETTTSAAVKPPTCERCGETGHYATVRVTARRVRHDVHQPIQGDEVCGCCSIGVDGLIELAVAQLPEGADRDEVTVEYLGTNGKWI